MKHHTHTARRALKSELCSHSFMHSKEKGRKSQTDHTTYHKARYET